MIQIIAGILVIVLLAMLIGSLVGRYILLGALVSIFFTDRSYASTPRSNKKIGIYGLILVVFGVLAIAEISDHKHSCAGKYNTYYNPIGGQADNPFSQYEIYINEQNRSEVCKLEFSGTAAACREYQRCIENPFYSWYLFFYLGGLFISLALLFRELRKRSRFEIELPPKSHSNSPTSVKKVASEFLESIKSKAPQMTVAELAKETGKSERGVRAYLTRNGIKAMDYDGTGKKSG